MPRFEETAMHQPHADPLSDLLAHRIAEVRRDIAQAEAAAAGLKVTLAEVLAVKVIRSDYPSREIYLLALATKRATVREVRESIRQGLELLAQYSALMDQIGDTPRANFH
jgi:F0F1-type ATP synthase membrane subunit b/b'